ncbi:MAG TPA: MBL fold metallo-hydrolase [Rhodanobacteraceae bacterium]|nr:MBL fold metallo-hydrolase [Rhodanobacteraceae bacterium]
MEIEFHGAAGEVTGSCHLVIVGGKQILLDCGMVQGNAKDAQRNAAEFPFDPKSVDVLVLSHAHIDHSGRVPLLVKRGFTGPIYTHAATIDLATILLADCAHIAQMDARDAARHPQPGQPILPPLYTQDDVDAAVKLMQPLAYGEAREILPGVRVTLRDAGHILGSATVELAADESGNTRKLVFSGDLGPTGTPILCDPQPVPAADLVIMESTYGDRLHKTREDTIAELAAIFAAAHKDGGNVVIPAFAVGRTQELLYFFAEHFDEWDLGHYKMFLDSPMASKVTAAYDRHEDLFDAEAKQLWSTRPHPLRLPNLTFTASSDDSRKINEIRSSAVIIAGSGMCEGGRIRHHLRHNLANPAAHIVFVGYQAQGTLGRRLVQGAKSVHLFGDEIPVRAHMHTVGGLSAHADRDGLSEWYGAIAGHPPVWLVHGEDPGRASLASTLHGKWGCEVKLAMPGMRAPV